MDLGLSGRVAMVAGASRGLGFATARVLAQEGAKVSILARDGEAVRDAVERLRSDTGAEVLGYPGDLRVLDDIIGWREQTREALGPVELLFANTGGPPPARFADVPDEGWQAGFDLLLLPMIRMAREVIPTMRETGGGSIVFCTSSAVKVPIPHLTVSTILRAGVSALSRTLAEEYAHASIRVNQIVPGRIETDRTRSNDIASAERAGITLEEQRALSVATIPLGRYGSSSEFAYAAAFLLSECASFITGATLQVDGGMIRSVL
jgi:3-oxoacyl-[acyl-carrier protein] reductase